jgi:multimeric flavodoxin WrbA
LKILAIVGSPRLDGNTNYLVDQALAEAEKLGAETEKIVISQHKVNPCLGHDNCASRESCTQKDDAGWIIDKFYEADGVILATPVYYLNVTAQMKAFLDRNYFPYKKNIRGRAGAVGIIVIAEQMGIEDTLYTLHQFIDWVFFVGKSRRFVVSGYANRRGDAQKNAQLVAEARELGRKVVASLKQES